MIWEDGPLTKAIKNGYSCVFTNISSAQTKVAERLNGLFDPKDSEEDYKFDLSENAEQPIIKINKKFHFISTYNIDKLKYLSPALLNRLMVINLNDQLENLKKKDFLELINIILENEYKGQEIDKKIVELIYENHKINKYSMSKLSKLSKSFYRLYLECKKKIDKKELMDYTHNLLYGKKSDINKIPAQIKNLANKLFSTNRQSSNDEKFYFQNSENLKNLMINLYSCSICGIPVCLVGSTGLGKTSMARAFSEYTRNEPAIMYSFHLETQIDDMFGIFTFKNGKPIKMEGPLTLALKEGRIFIGDEFNLAEDSILQTLSIAFENNDENSSYLIPGINEKIEYKKNFFFIACQNNLSTTGRKRLTHIIEKRLRIIIDYPLPDLNDLKTSCQDIIKENIIEDKNDSISYEDSMRAPIRYSEKYQISPEKLANFMYELNNDKNKKNIGTWSMRNIRKILRRHAYQQFYPKSYINVSFELQIVIYILSEIPKDKREDAFKELEIILAKTFKIEKKLIDNIRKVITGPLKVENKIINRETKKFLYKGESGIEIGNDFDGLENLNSLMETVFYTKFANFKEPINFCGPSSYKTFLAKRLALNADVINLYPETSVEQLLGSIYLVNNVEAKLYFLEKILTIGKVEDKIKDSKKIIKDYFNLKFEKENCKAEEKKEKEKNFRKAKASFENLHKEIIGLIEQRKKELPECIIKSLESLKKKLFENEESNKGIFKDFTSIFKTGILLDKILKQCPIILKNISNLSTAVLERFNDLFNYNPKLTLNEDFCENFPGEMRLK